MVWIYEPCDIVQWSAAPHHSIAYRTVFWVCVVLVLNEIWCSCQYSLDIILFHHGFYHDSCDYRWNFCGHLLPLDLHFRLLYICKCTTPWMFPPLDILHEYWIEHVSFGLLYVMFTFPTRIFYRVAPGFTTDCPRGVWCRGLTTYPRYVGPLFGNLV